MNNSIKEQIKELDRRIEEHKREYLSNHFEFSITADELKSIVEMIEEGYKCIEFTEGDFTLYLKLKDQYNNIEEFEFTKC